MSKMTIQEAVKSCSRPLITARPKGMSYSEYRSRLREQKAWLKRRLYGFLCYISSQLVVYDKKNGNYRDFIAGQDAYSEAHIRTNPVPFVGSARRDLNPV